ncbi:hypothetical protein ACLM5J_02955 [Nocardioides sp. Bht2]|uniref:hypothetical protein n=1 Tax=Nocardioides sp. Bht2 TaxID=3392297 RepID=UPI0039B44996
MKFRHLLTGLTSAALLLPGPGYAVGAEPEPDPTKYDRTPPVITLVYPEGGFEGWFPDTRTVSFVVTDDGTNGGVSSRVSHIEYQLSGATTDQGVLEGTTRGSFTITTEGSTQIDLTAYDGNGNHTPMRLWVGVDRTRPTVNFTGALATNGAEFALDSQVVVGFTCGDAHSGVASCIGDQALGSLIDTSTPGVYALQVQARDNVGNLRNQLVTYRVRPGAMGVSTPPRLIGEPRVGAVLRAEGTAFTPTPSTIEHRWYRDGFRLDDANGPTYRLQPADSGAEIHYVAVGRLDRHADAEATSSPVRVSRPYAAQGPLRVRGKAQVGGRLTAVLPTLAEPVPPENLVAVRGADPVDYGWYRNGRPIPGATASGYQLQASDVGARITVQATVRRPGFDPVTLRATTGRVAKASPVLTARITRGTARSAQLRVRVTGPAKVSGRVVVRAGGRIVGRAILRGGTGTVKVTRPGRGRLVLQIRYLGNRHLSAKQRRTTLR